MLTPAVNLNDVNHAIQLALAPVFLLTGIAGLLNVMTGRLSRIIDRGRSLTEDPGHVFTDNPELLAQSLSNLERRRHLASAAIAACTFSALLVCMVVAALFFEVMLGFKLSWVVGVLFTGSTLALIVGLTYFLREVHLATQTIRIKIKP